MFVLYMESRNYYKLKNIIPILFFLVFGLSFLSGQINDNIVDKNTAPEIDYKRFGPPYYPEIKLTEKDSFVWPIVFDFSMHFDDIKDFNVQNNFFLAKFTLNSYSKYDFKEYMTQDGFGIPLDHNFWYQINLPESDKRYMGTMIKINSYGDYYVYSQPYEEPDDVTTDSPNGPELYENIISKTSVYMENEFDHNWDLGNYPFDTQKLLFEIQTELDTSIVSIVPSAKFTSTFEKKMRSLTAGYEITEVTYRSEYKPKPSEIIQISPTIKRPMVTQSFLVELNIKRNGVVLFFKIFTGGILSYLISCMVFLIPLKELESRINLAVGGIFGAIGSSAFVYEVLPVVNVFNKADAINNLIIGMVVFNILVLLLQQGTFKRVNIDGKYFYQTKELKWFKNLQNSSYAFFYSIYVFAIVLTGILLW